jgi:hypothetical protein
MNIEVTLENVESVIADLDTLLEAGEIPTSDRSFVDDLVNGKYGFKKRGYLSEKQMFWAGRKLQAAVIGDRPTTSKLSGDLGGLVALFLTAKEHIKWPKITLIYEDATYRLAMAGPSSKKPGWINVTDGKPYGQNKWFGRISPEGLWEQPHMLDEAVAKSLLRLLNAFSKDAAAAAQKYGKLTGNCCFCNTPLGEGDDQTSVEWGYGPVCAKNFGLPWGKKK